MDVLDFSPSFLLWRVDEVDKPPQTASHKPPYSLNNARVLVDATCDVVDQRTEDEEHFVLGASCKTERVGVERDIWLEPNSDFVSVFSDTDFMYIKTYEHTGRTVMYYPESRGLQPHRERVRSTDAFDHSEAILCRSEGEFLDTPEAVVKAILANDRLVCRTTIRNDRYVATLEYPGKTMNANDRDGIFQPDTGPVLLPDLDGEPEDLMDGLELAFAAFNRPDWVECLVRVPVPVTDEITVYHYAKPVRWDAHNEVVRLA